MGTISLDKFCKENDVELTRMDGHDNAIIGILRGTGFPHNTTAPRLVYDVAVVISNLMSDGMDEDVAEEFFEYNIIGSYVGEQTPLFLDRFSFVFENKQEDVEGLPASSIFDEVDEREEGPSEESPPETPKIDDSILD